MPESITSDSEKVAVEVASLSSESLRKEPEDPALEKVWRTIDFYVLPVAAMFYLLSFLVSSVLTCELRVHC